MYCYNDFGVEKNLTIENVSKIGVFMFRNTLSEV